MSSNRNWPLFRWRKMSSILSYLIYRNSMQLQCKKMKNWWRRENSWKPKFNNLFKSTTASSRRRMKKLKKWLKNTFKNIKNKSTGSHKISKSKNNPICSSSLSFRRRSIACMKKYKERNKNLKKPTRNFSMKLKGWKELWMKKRKITSNRDHLLTPWKSNSSRVLKKIELISSKWEKMN